MMFLVKLSSLLLLVITLLPSLSEGGAVYTRWGRSDCPATAELVYNGYAGGTRFSHNGGGANRLCLPRSPQWSYETSNLSANRAGVYGGEYMYPSAFPFPSSSFASWNVPCVVCKACDRSTMLMIPARMECYPGWTREYWGFLTAAKDTGTHYRAEFTCMDITAQKLTGTSAPQIGAKFFVAEARYGSLPYSILQHMRELTCVVCTK